MVSFSFLGVPLRSTLTGDAQSSFEAEIRINVRNRREPGAMRLYRGALVHVEEHQLLARGACKGPQVMGAYIFAVAGRGGKQNYDDVAFVPRVPGVTVIAGHGSRNGRPCCPCR